VTELGAPQPPRGGIESNQYDDEGNLAQQDQSGADPTRSVLPEDMSGHVSRENQTEDLLRDHQPPGTADPIAGDRPMTGQGTGASGGYGTGSGVDSSGGSPDGREGESGGVQTDWLRSEETPSEVPAEDARDA
jgi:hypothetical protein